MSLQIAKTKRTGGREGSRITFLESSDPRPFKDFRQFNYQLAKALGIRYVDVREIVDCFIDQIAEYVARGHRVVFPGFGRFEAPKRQPKLVNDHWRGRQYMWNGGNRAKFRPSNDWVSTINDEPTQKDRLRYKRNWAARRKQDV